MDVDVNTEAKDKRLNRLVALTVVILSVFAGVCNIKDGNIVQAMQQAQSDSLDRWNEYQATRTKLHIAETARTEIAVLARQDAKSAASLRQLDSEIAKYKAESPGLARSARDFADRYDALNIHDDQFDASEAATDTAISMAAVAALAESFGLLAGAWAIGAFGLFMGLCGFAGWPFHSDLLSTLLG